jgi:membrane-associated phospholipid phosphatase
MLKWLEHMDKVAFSFVQQHFAGAWMDGLMLLLRNPPVWIPLYIFMFVWALRQGKKSGLLFICLSLICFAITDYSVAHLFKPLFGRIRPCYDADTAGIVRGIIGCGGKLSFPSSHAANHFGLAAFWYMAVYRLSRRKWNWLFLWASLISFAQVYVGVHFPLDIAGGALLGLLTGFSLGRLFEIFMRPRAAKSIDQSSLSLP